MKLVIGTDGSPCAEHAIQDLRHAGLPNDTQAVVLCVADLLMEAPFPEHDEGVADFPAEIIRAARAAATDAMERARETAKKAADLLESLFPAWLVTSEWVGNSPYWALIQKAEQFSADLVVVGSHGRSTLGRFVLGSVSQNVLSHAPCSVRIGRCGNDVGADGKNAGEALRLVLGIDGSPDSALAIDALCSRKWRAGTQVHVITAVDLKLSTAPFFLQGSTGAGAGAHDVMTVARRRVDAVVDELRNATLQAEAVVLEGDPKKVLVQHAEQWAADCIFLGAQGHSRRDRFLLGSVSAAVAARAHCSVEIVRQP